MREYRDEGDAIIFCSGPEALFCITAAPNAVVLTCLFVLAFFPRATRIVHGAERSVERTVMNFLREVQSPFCYCRSLDKNQDYFPLIIGPYNVCSEYAPQIFFQLSRSS